MRSRIMKARSLASIICPARKSEDLMIYAMLVLKVGFTGPFGTTVCNANHINAKLSRAR